MCLNEGCTLEPLYLYLEISFAVNLLFSVWNRMYDDWKKVMDKFRAEHQALTEDDYIQEEVSLVR